MLTALSPIAVARKQATRIATALSLLFARPREAPRSVALAARYLWNVQVRRKKLLVLARFGGLGDMACMLGSVPGLKKRHPNSWMVVISPPGCWELVASSGLSDAVADRESFFHWLVNRLCRNSSFYHPLLPDEYEPPLPQTLHLADEFARALGVAPDLSCIAFRAPGRVRRGVARRLRKINPDRHPVVVLHPGPTWPVREWPAHRWSELAEFISKNTPAVMIKIGTDRDSMGRARPSAPIPNATDWTNQLNITETAALLEQANAFVGIDSGPLHIAGVLKVPAVGLFGPIAAKLRLHPQARATIVTGSVDCLGCHHRPTGQLHWKTGCPYHIVCMDQISAEDVYTALAPHIDGSNSRKVASDAKAILRQE